MNGGADGKKKNGEYRERRNPHYFVYARGVLKFIKKYKNTIVRCEFGSRFKDKS
jgi:hypothetical protein